MADVELGREFSDKSERPALPAIIARAMCEVTEGSPIVDRKVVGCEIDQLQTSATDVLVEAGYGSNIQPAGGVNYCKVAQAYCSGFKFLPRDCEQARSFKGHKSSPEVRPQQ